MKKIGKLLAGIAIVGAIAFTGCQAANEVLGNGDMIDYTSKNNPTTKAIATASIDKTNDTGDELRGMRLFNNKKKGITLKMQMTDAIDYAGNLGVVFDLVKNKDDTYNFILVGYRCIGGAVNYYVAYYTNIEEGNFDATDFGTTEPGTKAHRKDIQDFAQLSTIKKAADGSISLGVLVLPLSAKEADKNEDYYSEDNAYAIFFYDANEETVDNLKTLTDASYSDKKEAAKATVWVARSDIGEDDTNKKVEQKMGFYARVAGNSSLKGTWQVADIENEPAEIIWADEADGKAAVLPYDTLGIN